MAVQHTIPVIDLFAGPGGLGEGFSVFAAEADQRPFQIRLSVEKDACAYKILRSRSFFRQNASQYLTASGQPSRFGTCM